MNSNNGQVIVESQGSHSVLIISKRTRTWRCLVDTADIPLVMSARRVNVSCGWSGNRRRFYVTLLLNGQTELLHVAILGARSGYIVDHKNGDSLDCRRSNLRHVTRSINAFNRNSLLPSSSGIRGISSTNRGAWRATLAISGHPKSFGTYADVRDAVEAVWLALLNIDCVSAENFLRSIPLTYENWVESRRTA